ncbi:MAG: ATP-binding protein [Verrucomicrobiota bacterium]|jgi:hypothetical protein
MAITLPPFLEEKLSGNKNLRAAVDGTVADFDSWLKDSKLPFFTDYTDHGPEHLNQVLSTAVGLMTNEARELFTDADAAVLVIATLLHDSAMHLSEVGFKELIKGKASHRLIADFDSQSWPELWDEFFFIARRWDDQKINDVFGELKDGETHPTIRDPFENYHNLSDWDRKLIGEFIRSHHPRMAHEFAIYGVPGPAADPIIVDKRLGGDLADIAGLIARSHGLPVRQCVDYLSKKGYHKRDFKGVHAVYLMTLLRVSDYIQIQADRADKIAFRYRHIPSRISQEEWKAHNAITNITRTHEDPESLEIQAKPVDVRTFLRLKDWMAGIQRELDASWAVLGEIYGRYQDLHLDDLGMVIRRVRSNLDNVREFADEVEYVPERIEFTVARAELLKLLVRPLYGDRPEIGIRELLQNAVDAVREREKFQQHHPQYSKAPLRFQAADVVISIDVDKTQTSGVLTISDRGIGMTEQVIRDYFLNIGASFRRSQAWQIEYERADVSSGLRSEVLRSGRFGVGVLAVFLLGKEIEVETRSITSQRGIAFRTTLDGGPIELRYRDDIPTGTLIRVALVKDIVSKLLEDAEGRKRVEKWDWYCFKSPSVRRFVNKTEIKPEWELSPTHLEKDWNCLTDSRFEAINWTFSEAPSLICNGIIVKEQSSGRYSTLVSHGALEICEPNISVLDPDGNLPLNLQREDLSAELPFRAKLGIEIIHDLLSFLLVRLPSSVPPRVIADFPRYDGLKQRWSYYRDTDPWLYTETGCCPLQSWNIKKTGIKCLVHLNMDRRFGEFNFLPITTPNANTGFAVHKVEDAWSGRMDFIRALAENRQLSGDLQKLALSGIRLLLTKEVAERMKKTFPKYLKRKYKIEHSIGDWQILQQGSCGETNFDLKKLKSEQPKSETSRFMTAEWFLGEKQPDFEAGTLGQIWEKLIRLPVVPYDMTVRKKNLADAFSQLKYYIDKHRQSKDAK